MPGRPGRRNSSHVGRLPGEVNAHRFMASIFEFLQVELKKFLEVRFDRLPELRLVVLKADHEVATTLDDLARDLFLATHGVDRDHRVRKLDLLQKLGNRRSILRRGR